LVPSDLFLFKLLLFCLRCVAGQIIEESRCRGRRILVIALRCKENSGGLLFGQVDAASRRCSIA